MPSGSYIFQPAILLQGGNLGQKEGEHSLYACTSNGKLSSLLRTVGDWAAERFGSWPQSSFGFPIAFTVVVSQDMTSADAVFVQVNSLSLPMGSFLSFLSHLRKETRKMQENKRWLKLTLRFTGKNKYTSRLYLIYYLFLLLKCFAQFHGDDRKWPKHELVWNAIGARVLLRVQKVPNAHCFRGKRQSSFSVMLQSWLTGSFLESRSAFPALFVHTSVRYATSGNAVYNTFLYYFSLCAVFCIIISCFTFSSSFKIRTCCS